jgi:hypothetical protein
MSQRDERVARISEQYEGGLLRDALDAAYSAGAATMRQTIREAVEACRSERPTEGLSVAWDLALGAALDVIRAVPVE